MKGSSLLRYLKYILVAASFFSLVSCGSSTSDFREQKPNSAPVANAGSDQVGVAKRSLVKLDGSMSSDPDGPGVLTYTWVQKEGSPVILTGGGRPTFIAPAQAQRLIFELTVTDEMGLSALSSDSVKVIVTNHIPVADAGDDQTVTYVWLAPAEVKLDGNASTDTDKDSLKFSWTYTGCIGECAIDDPRGGGLVPVSVTLSDPLSPTPGFTVPQAWGVDLQFLLKVTDEDGFTSEAVTQVHINSRSPWSNAGLDETGVYPGSLITLDGTASGDSDTTASQLDYLWRQISGTPVLLNNPMSSIASFTYPLNAADRSLEFELVLNDGESDSLPDTVLVTGLGYDGVNINHKDNPFPLPVTALPGPAMGIFNALTVQNNMALKGTDVYVPNRNGLTIINAGEPLMPNLWSEIPAIGVASDLRLVGNEAFVFKGAGVTTIDPGLEIVNVSNPSLPDVTGSVALTTPAYGVAGELPLNIAVSGDIAYMVDYFTGLTIVDVSNRTSPRVVSKTTSNTNFGWPSAAELVSNDIYFTNSTGVKVIDVSNNSTLASPENTNITHYTSDLKFNNDLLYITGAETNGLYYDGGLEIYKPVDRNNFRKLSSIVTNGNATDLSIIGNTVYVADGKASFQGHLPAVNIFDVSDLSVPDWIGSYKIPSILSDPRAIEVSNNVAYVINYSTGLVVIPGLKTSLARDLTIPVVAGTTILYSFGWVNPGTSVLLECRTSAGSCTIDKTAEGLAEVQWVLPTTSGRYKIAATVGNHHYFLSATDYVAVP